MDLHADRESSDAVQVGDDRRIKQEVARRGRDDAVDDQRTCAVLHETRSEGERITRRVSGTRIRQGERRTRDGRNLRTDREVRTSDHHADRQASVAGDIDGVGEVDDVTRGGGDRRACALEQAVERERTRSGVNRREVERTINRGRTRTRHAEGSRARTDNVTVEVDRASRVEDQASAVRHVDGLAGGEGDRCRERACIDSDAVRTEGTITSEGGGTTVDRERTRRGKGGGRERTCRLGHAGGGEATSESRGAGVSKGTRRGQRTRTKGTTGDIEGSGRDGTSRGEGTSGDEVTRGRQAADRERAVSGISQAAGDGERLTRADVRTARDGSLARGGVRCTRDRASQGQGTQLKGGRTRGVQGRTRGHGRGHVGGQGISDGQGARRHVDVGEAGGARERRGARVILKKVTEATNLVSDGRIRLL